MLYDHNRRFVLCPVYKNDVLMSLCSKTLQGKEVVVTSDEQGFLTKNVGFLALYLEFAGAM